MIESLGTLAYELAVESLIASAILWAAILLVIRLYHINNRVWQSRFFLLPVVLPLPLIPLVHLLVRPRLLWPSRTPLEQMLASVADASPWVPPIALGLTAVALLSGGVQVLRLFVTLHRQREEWRRQQREPSPLWLRCNNLLHVVARRQLMTPARVVLVNGRNSGSLALGPLGSYVLVSRNLAPLLDDRELEGLLAHELAHVGRWDTLVDALTGLARQLLAFSPFVHWAYRRFTWAREEAVDEEAVRASGDPLALASCLVKACRFSQAGARPGFGSAFLRSTGALEWRVRRLIDLPTNNPNPPRCHRGAFWGVIAVVATLFLLTL